MTTTIKLFWVLVILNIVDVIFTANIISMGGVEINPFMLQSIERFGFLPGLILPKLLGILMVGYLIYYTTYKHIIIPLIMGFVVLCYSALIIHSYILLQNLSGTVL